MTNITILPPLNLEHPNLLVLGYAKQNDVKSRLFQAQMLAGDEAWEPPANATAALRFRKGDNHGGWYDTLEDNSTPAVTWTGSVVTMAMAEQALTCPGIVLIDLEFSGPDGSVLSFFRWQLVVEANAVDDAILTESSDYFNLLHQEMTAVLAAAANLTGLTASASGLPTGSAPTVNVTGGSGGDPYHLLFGIPAGPVGPPDTPTVSVKYQAGNDYSTPPTGTWGDSPPVVPAGSYLWTRIVLTYSTGSPATYYSVAYQGQNGAGTLISTFINQTVATSAWASDSTYSDYGYKADITLSGVTASDFGIVTFAPGDAHSGNFAPVCQTISGGVRIYARSIPSEAVTIPTISTWR